MTDTQPTDEQIERAAKDAGYPKAKAEEIRILAAGGDRCNGPLFRPILAHARTIAEKDATIARLRHIAHDLLQHVDWLTCGLPEMLEKAALTDEEGLIGAAVDAANNARAALGEQP